MFLISCLLLRLFIPSLFFLSNCCSLNGRARFGFRFIYFFAPGSVALMFLRRGPGVPAAGLVLPARPARGAWSAGAGPERGAGLARGARRPGAPQVGGFKLSGSRRWRWPEPDACELCAAPGVFLFRAAPARSRRRGRPSGALR